MGIRDCRFFAVPMVAVLLVVAGCSASDPAVVSGSAQSNVADDDAGSVDEDELDDGSVGGDHEGFPDAPELPDAVKDPSDDGAEAAVEYFFEAYTHAFQTSDIAPFSEITTDDCESCQEIISAFQEREERHEYARTDGYSEPEFISFDEEEEYHVAHVTIDFDGETIIYEDGSEELLLEETTYSVLMALDFIDDQWFVTKTNAQKVNE